MPAVICTIGFAGKTAEQFFALLTQAGVRRVIDTRENRIGQLSGFAKYPDVAFLLDRVAGIAYSWEPSLAPSPEIRKAYRETKDWAAYEASFLQLMGDRGVPETLNIFPLEGTVALLCSEPGPQKCHRRLVAELLADYLQGQGRAVEIHHLVIEKPVKLKQARRPRREPAA